MEPKRRPRSTHAAVCRKHPKHRQSPGVCSVCLTEKLSKLAAAAANTTATSSGYSSSSSLSSLSSLSSSSEISSYSSPVHRHYFRRGKIGLMKSKSMAFVARSRGGGFWSKLLGHRSEKRVDLVHSRTMRETTFIH